MTYNGWSNYETWNVKLWLDNDGAGYQIQSELAGRITDAWDLASAIKDLVEEGMPDLGASMYADLLGAALKEVDWHEIAEAILEDNEES